MLRNGRLVSGINCNRLIKNVAMGSGLSREQSVKSTFKSPPRRRRPKGSLHSLIETDEEEEGAGCDCDCCREECDCVSDGHMTLLTDRQRKLRCMAAETEKSKHWNRISFMGKVSF